MHSKRASKGTKEEEATWRAYDVTDHRTTKTTTSKKNGGSKRGGLSLLSFFTPLNLLGFNGVLCVVVKGSPSKYRTSRCYAQMA